MRLSKAQTVVITLLNVVIVVLVALIFFVPTLGAATADAGGNDDPPAVKPDPPTEHVKLRDASDGKVSEIARETRLMGAGDETVVEIYERDGVVYIFGNATVKGLDFDSYGGFLCVVNAAGTILSFTYFDGKIGAVGKLASGYAVGAGEALYFVDYTGEAVKKAELRGEALFAAAVASDRIAVVTQPAPTSLYLTEYAVTANGEVSVGHGTRIDNGFTLKFFDCYYFGESYVIAARAHNSPRYDAVVFFTFTAGGDAASHYYGGSGDNITRPYAVMPCDAGYFALCSVNGLATVITVDYKFVSYHSINLGFTFTDASLFFARGRYYASFKRTDGAVTYELGGDLSRRTLGSLDGLFLSNISATDDGVIAMGTVTSANGDTAAEIVSVYADGKVALDIADAVFYGGYENGGKLTVVLSATGGAALSETSGGRDVYVITVSGA